MTKDSRPIERPVERPPDPDSPGSDAGKARHPHCLHPYDAQLGQIEYGGEGTYGTPLVRCCQCGGYRVKAEERLPKDPRHGLHKPDNVRYVTVYVGLHGPCSGVVTPPDPTVVTNR